MMVDELYQVLMNKGFLIHSHDAKFVLQKIPTQTDPRTSITSDVQPDTSFIKFDTFDEALQTAKSLVAWKDKSAIIQQSNSVWFMQLMYRHKSGPKFVDLGEMGSVPYDVAISEAKARATRYIEESCAEEDIEGWDVRVRPTHPKE